MRADPEVPHICDAGRDKRPCPRGRVLVDEALERVRSARTFPRRRCQIAWFRWGAGLAEPADAQANQHEDTVKTSMRI